MQCQSITLRNIGIHTTKYHLIIKITTQHKCDNQTCCNFTSICAVNSQVLFVMKKNPRLPKGIIVKNTHRSIYPLIMLLRNAEGRYLYLILKDIDVVLKKGIKRY